MTDADRAWLNHLANTQCQIIYSKDVWSSGDIAKQIVEARRYIANYLSERGGENEKQFSRPE